MTTKVFDYKLFAVSESSELMSMDAPVELFRVVTEKPPPISVYLQRNHSPEIGTVHASLLSIYQSAGWSTESDSCLVEKEPDSLEPILKIPSIEFALFYTVIGVSTDLLERFFRRACSKFSLTLLLLEMSRDFGLSVEKCFPSLRFEVSNREKQIERSRQKRQKEKDEMEKKFARIIPIFSLPLVLSRLPEFYQGVNITLSQCELLEKMIWSSLEVRRDNNVKEQLSLMKHNRRFLHFQQQTQYQSLHDKRVDQYELEMKETELLFIQLYESERRSGEIKESKRQKNKRQKK